MGVVVVDGGSKSVYHAEYGDCVLANAKGGSITVVLPAPLRLVDLLPFPDEPALKLKADIIVSNLRVYVKKIDNSENEVVVVAPRSKIDGGAIAVLKKQYESVLLTTDGENWFIM